MKTFEIITEADARVLETGETVALARGGLVTPLAQDTLRARRVTVIRDDGTSVDESRLAPAAEIRTVAVAGDHHGAALRRSLVAFLRSRGLAVNDLGTDTPDPKDETDLAVSVADLVAHRESDAGIVIERTGIGSAIAANKVPGVRAAMATSETIARYARQHSGTNVLTLGALLVSESEMQAIVTAWLTTPMREPREIRRLAKLQALERRGHPLDAGTP